MQKTTLKKILYLRTKEIQCVTFLHVCITFSFISPLEYEAQFVRSSGLPLYTNYKKKKKKTLFFSICLAYLSFLKVKRYEEDNGTRVRKRTRRKKRGKKK